VFKGIYKDKCGNSLKLSGSPKIFKEAYKNGEWFI
jgi:hypothetical protein